MDPEEFKRKLAEGFFDGMSKEDIIAMFERDELSGMQRFQAINRATGRKTGVKATIDRRATDRFDRNHVAALYALDRTLLANPAATPYSEEWWFGYFIKEKKLAQSWNDNLSDVLAFFNTLYDFPDEWKTDVGALPALGGRLTTKLSWTAFANSHTAVFRKMMDVLLNDGFVRIPAAAPDTVAPNDPTYVLASRFEFSRDRGHKVALFWRGDDRSFGDLETAGGLVNKAQSDYAGWAASKNFHKPWHPFSDPANARDYWYRKGSADNCLMTVVSATADPRTAVTFPLLNDVPGLVFTPDWRDLAGGLDPLNAAARPKHRNFSMIRGKSGQHIVYADSIQLYLAIIDSNLFFTSKYQEEEGAEAFPEIAVKKIDYPNIMASMTFVRVFHGSTDAEGLTVLVHGTKSNAPTLDRCKRKLGMADKNADILLEAVMARFRDAKQMHGDAYKWTPTGGVKVESAFRGIKEVVRGDGQPLWMQANAP